MQSFTEILRFLLLGLLAVLLLLGFGLWQARHLESAAVDLSLSVTEQVLANHNLQSLTDLSHPSLQSSMSEDYWQRYLALLERLGSLELIAAIDGDSNVPVLVMLPADYTASYKLASEFSNGAATVSVALIYSEGKWQIAGFQVDSPLTNE